MECTLPRLSPASIRSAILCGVDARVIRIEAIMHGDGRAVQMLGSVDRVVRESVYRVLNAFRAVDLPPPRGVPIVNFAPADIPKTGTTFDLPLALALAAANGQIPPERIENVLAVGEITLQGGVLPARGIVPMAVAARGIPDLVVLAARESAEVASAVSGIDVVAVDSLADAIAFAQGRLPLAPLERRRAPVRPRPAETTPDLGDVRGLESAKRALAAAAAGGHNVLMIGPPGSGKSALARRIQGLVPPLSEPEALDVLRIRSAVDSAPGAALPRERPFRAPHHTSSTSSLLGGGSEPRPGEVTLAHHGILFLDEFAEFRREALEGLRQPLEDGRITIGRAQRTVEMPACFALIAAMNPCPCGFDGDGRHACRCAPHARMAYRARVSGPLRDRFDLVVWVPSLDAGEYAREPDPQWSTRALRAKVLRARRAAGRRHHGTNARLDGDALRAAASLDEGAEQTLLRLTRLHRMSGRGRTRTLRLARTLADLGRSEHVRDHDIVEAARYRMPEFAW